MPGSCSTYVPGMREATKLLLDGKIGRRAFIYRLGQIGMASSLASGLEGAPSEPVAGRVVRGMTGGELMAELLVEWNVPYVFGLGGSEEVGFLDALVDRLALQYVHGIHEASVMSMADGYARATEDVPIMNLHSVPGAAYALGPMVNAFKDRIPVVVTVARQSTDMRGTNAFLESVNLHQLPQEYTQWTWDVMNAKTIPEVVRRIADMLVEAEFPVIAVGKEGARFDPSEPLMELAELLGAPVFQDIYMAHGPMVFPSTHPHYAGMFRQDPSYPTDIDLYWALGGTMFGFGKLPSEPIVPRTAKVIHSGLDSAEVSRTYPADLAVIAGVKATLAAVLDELRRRDLPKLVVEDRKRHVEEYHAGMRARLAGAAETAWDRSPITNERLMVELNRRIAPDAIVVSELITSEPYVPYYLDIDHTRTERRRNLATSSGVLGWGVPAAIGAHIGRQDRECLALVGDGCFQFGVHRLWTTARYEVPVGIVIWNNGQYQANRRFLHAYGGRAAETGKYIGCNLASPEIDNVALAKGYGVEGDLVEEPGEVGPAIERCLRAMREGRPYVLDVKVERRFGGSESTWYDFFSVAKRQARQS